jgi:hypothetical protein
MHAAPFIPHHLGAHFSQFGSSSYCMYLTHSSPSLFFLRRSLETETRIYILTFITIVEICSAICAGSGVSRSKVLPIHLKKLQGVKMSRQITQPITQVRLTNVAVVRVNRHGKRFEVRKKRAIQLVRLSRNQSFLLTLFPILFILLHRLLATETRW